MNISAIKMNESEFKNITLSDIGNEILSLGKFDDTGNINITKLLNTQ